MAFINQADPPKYDPDEGGPGAFTASPGVHPFSNGNGRVVRLLTYAMLIKYGYPGGAAGRLLNHGGALRRPQPLLRRAGWRR
ncbi:MAG: hypothetical protein U1E77_14110 [Inhella sp.]